MESKADLPFISVVISFHNDAALLRTCLLSLLNQTYPRESHEIILINDGSVDSSQETVSDILVTHQASVKLFIQPDRGPAAARNLGIANARGNIVAFTDPDCTVDETWLAQHARGYVSEEVGGVEGRVETDWASLLYPIRISPAGFRYVTCNISYRREVLEKVAFFDEAFRWKEDDELAYRVIKAGWTIRSEDRAVVYHPVKNLTLRGLVSHGMKRRYDVLFYKKHPDSVRSYFRAIRVGPVALTREFLASCAAVFAILLIGTTFSLNAILGVALVAVLASILAFEGRMMLKRRTRASIFWMAVFTLLVEIGRLRGCFKFRRFLL